MPVVFEVSIERAFRDPTNYPTDLVSKWESKLKGLRDTILNRIQQKIASETDYKDLLATPSAEKYADFVNPSYVRADFIKLKQKTKVMGRGLDYINNVANAFAEGGVFETNVSAKKDKLKLAIYTLDAVGVKYLGKDASNAPLVVAAIRAITGDKRGELLLKYHNISGTIATITDLFPAGVNVSARSSLVFNVVQGVVLLAFAYKANDSSLYDSIMTEINSVLDKIMGMRDSSKYPTAYVHFEAPSGYPTDLSKYKVHIYVESA